MKKDEVMPVWAGGKWRSFPEGYNEFYLRELFPGRSIIVRKMVRLIFKLFGKTKSYKENTWYVITLGDYYFSFAMYGDRIYVVDKEGYSVLKILVPFEGDDDD